MLFLLRSSCSADGAGRPGVGVNGGEMEVPRAGAGCAVVTVAHRPVEIVYSLARVGGYCLTAGREVVRVGGGCEEN